MKKWIVLLSVLLLFAGKGFTQHFGIKGGVNISNYYDYNHNVLEVTSHNTTHFGVVAFWAPSRVIGFQAEVLYNQKGGKYDAEILDDQEQFVSMGERTDEFNYVEVPILLKVPIDIFQIRPEFVVGPSFSYLLSRKSIVEGPDFHSEATSTDGYSKYVFSLVFGGDLFVPLFSGGVLLDIRYLVGMSSFVDFNGSTMKHQQLMFSAGYVF